MQALVVSVTAMSSPVIPEHATVLGSVLLNPGLHVHVYPPAAVVALETAQMVLAAQAPARLHGFNVAGSTEGVCVGGGRMHVRLLSGAILFLGG